MWTCKQKSRVPVALYATEPPNVKWGRHVAVQKAKVARQYAKWGHGVPKASPYGRALTGHGALFTWQETIIKFLHVCYLTLSACCSETAKQWAMVAQALQWLQQGAATSQCQKWYEILYRELKAKCRQWQWGANPLSP